MDYETKIYLDNLIEAVEKLNSPDWWSIGITIVNALIMIWLGCKQYKLQKEQSKLQEYAIYRKLYELVKTMDGLIKNIYTIHIFTTGHLEINITSLLL